MREPTIAWWPGIITPGQVGGALSFTRVYWTMYGTGFDEYCGTKLYWVDHSGMRLVVVCPR